MRIWHQKLIPKLCRQHLLGVWREGLGCYKIITEDKKGYRNHPATQEFIECSFALWTRLQIIREEMLKRGYNPKDMPTLPRSSKINSKEWQTYKKQVEILKAKGCECKV